MHIWRSCTSRRQELHGTWSALQLPQHLVNPLGVSARGGPRYLGIVLVVSMYPWRILHSPARIVVVFILWTPSVVASLNVGGSDHPSLFGPVSLATIASGESVGIECKGGRWSIIRVPLHILKTWCRV